MKEKNVVVRRIIELCEERNINYYKLANRAAIKKSVRDT